MNLKGCTMKWYSSTMSGVAAAVLMNAAAMAQTPYTSPDSNRMASIAQRFDSTERGWQDESKSSASRVEPTNRYAEPSDTRADAQQMWRGKFVAHAMETGAVANAAVNTPRMDARQPPADATVPLASLSPAQQNAYYESIARDAKP
jgi:hypothetical protein